MTELAGITCGHFWSENRQRISWLERKRAAYPAGQVAHLHWPTCLHLIFPAAHPRPDPFVHLSALIYLDGRRQTRSFHPRPGGFIWFSFAWCRWHEKWQWMDPLSIVCPSIDPLFCFSCGGSERLVLRPIGRLCHRPKRPLTDVFIFWRQFCFWITKWRQNAKHSSDTKWHRSYFVGFIFKFDSLWREVERASRRLIDRLPLCRTHTHTLTHTGL